MKLSTLTKFNQALAYTFEIEAMDAVDEDQLMVAMYGQYEDVLNAYLYAQDEVLPFLAKGLDRVTPDEALIKVIKEFNRLATAWHEDDLNRKEREVVGKFAAFIRDPHHSN